MATMSMNEVFVTGGSGFVGRNLIRALRERGVTVRALARSDASAAAVASLGAEPVRADLLDVQREHIGTCDTVFHAAAFVGDWGALKAARRLNVDGTRAVLDAAGDATVVHVSTESVLIGGPPLVNADETWPYPKRPLGVYAITKGEAERLAVSRGAIVVRPRFIWGNDDSTLLPAFVEATEKKMLRWFAGGEYLTSTCHVDNCVHGMLLAAERGAAGEIYFLTDGEPVSFRWIVSEMLRSQGVEPPTGTMPRSLARVVAAVGEMACKVLPGRPPLTRYVVRVIGESVTVSDAKARQELGYQPVTSVEAGLEDLRRRAAS